MKEMRRPLRPLESCPRVGVPALRRPRRGPASQRTGPPLSGQIGEPAEGDGAIGEDTGSGGLAERAGYGPPLPSGPAPVLPSAPAFSGPLVFSGAGRSS